jgi:hypothetical protein
MPAVTPVGVPSKVAAPTIINDPKMALDRPPVSACGGGVISVNTARLMPLTPKRTVSANIQINQNRPKAIAASDSVNAMALIRLRRLCLARRGSLGASIVVLMNGPPHPFSTAPAAAWTAPARQT